MGCLTCQGRYNLRKQEDRNPPSLFNIKFIVPSGIFYLPCGLLVGVGVSFFLKNGGLCHSLHLPLDSSRLRLSSSEDRFKFLRKTQKQHLVDICSWYTKGQLSLSTICSALSHVLKIDPSLAGPCRKHCLNLTYIQTLIFYSLKIYLSNGLIQGDLRIMKPFQ